jgi:hypothetical protein
MGKVLGKLENALAGLKKKSPAIGVCPKSQTP